MCRMANTLNGKYILSLPTLGNAVKQITLEVCVQSRSLASNTDNDQVMVVAISAEFRMQRNSAQRASSTQKKLCRSGHHHHTNVEIRTATTVEIQQTTKVEMHKTRKLEFRYCFRV